VEGSNSSGLFGHLSDTHLNKTEGLVFNGHCAALGLGGWDE
jgi:hypothetical protein